MLCVGGRVVHEFPPWRYREGCTAQAVFAQSFPGLPPYCPTPPYQFTRNFLSRSRILTLGRKWGWGQISSSPPRSHHRTSAPSRVGFPKNIRGGGQGQEKTNWSVLQH